MQYINEVSMIYGIALAPCPLCGGLCIPIVCDACVQQLISQHGKLSPPQPVHSAAPIVTKEEDLVKRYDRTMKGLV